MSYSFAVCGSTKAETLTKLGEELDNVVLQQPVHSADRQQAYAAAEAFLEIIPPTEGHDFYISVSGSIGWLGEHINITSASVNVSASLVTKEAAGAAA